jgi:hypothetical protein
MLEHGRCVLVRVWDTTSEEHVTSFEAHVRPCDERLMITRLDVMHIANIPASYEPGTVVVLTKSLLPGLPVAAKPALVLHCGSFTPDGHPIVDVAADPEYLPEVDA